MKHSTGVDNYNGHNNLSSYLYLSDKNMHTSLSLYIYALKGDNRITAGRIGYSG